MQRKALVKLWEDAWQEGLWAVPWSKGAGGPDGIPGGVEAASRAAFDLAIAHHLLFWRQVTLHVARGEPEPDQAETLSRSWEEPSQTDAGAWRATVRGFETSQRDLVGALTACDRELHRFHYHRFHDSYHIGQIMQQRAIQGLAPLV